MKMIKYLTLTLAGIFFLAVSCSDDKELVPVWESGINGQGLITSVDKDFRFTNPSIALDFELKWISVDDKASVTKIEVFILFKEKYKDLDGRNKVADHGGAAGRLLRTFEGAAVPANRVPVAFSLTQDEVYNLYNGITYDYGDGNGVVNVWDNPYSVDRNTGNNKLVTEDDLTMIWQFTAADGRVFDAWSPSVCTEFPGSNCQLDFGASCAVSIADPKVAGGMYTITMNDSYGDGWNGAFITATVDGVNTDYSITGSTGTAVVDASAASTLTFTFTGGSWDSEITYTITSPQGNAIASHGPSPAIGPIKLFLCLE